MPYYLFPGPSDPITAYHGTSSACAANIERQGFLPSLGPGEWLGHGAYFFDDLEMAWFWAERDHGQKAAVVKATLVLGYCLNLDALAPLADFLRDVHTELEAQHETSKTPFPINEGSDYRYYCALLNLAATRTSPATNSIIRVCPAGTPILPTGDLLSETGRQICMRTLSNIHNPIPVYRRTS